MTAKVTVAIRFDPYDVIRLGSLIYLELKADLISLALGFFR